MSEKVKARQEALRLRLIESAERQIIEQGKEGLRARILAQDAVCSVGSIYFLFADLDALVAEVNRRTLTGLRLGLSEVSEIEGLDHPADRMVALGQAYARYAAQNTPRWMSMMTPLAITEKGENVFADVVGAIVGDFEAALPKSPDSANMARTIFSAIHGIVYLGLTRDPQQDVEQLEAEVDLLVCQIGIGEARVTPEAVTV